MCSFISFLFERPTSCVQSVAFFPTLRAPTPRHAEPPDPVGLVCLWYDLSPAGVAFWSGRAPPEEEERKRAAGGDSARSRNPPPSARSEPQRSRKGTYIPPTCPRRPRATRLPCFLANWWDPPATIPGVALLRNRTKTRIRLCIPSSAGDPHGRAGEGKRVEGGAKGERKQVSLSVPGQHRHPKCRAPHFPRRHPATRLPFLLLKCQGPSHSPPCTEGNNRFSPASLLNLSRLFLYRRFPKHPRPSNQQPTLSSHGTITVPTLARHSGRGLSRQSSKKKEWSVSRGATWTETPTPLRASRGP